jgi:hypothetical protein
MNYEAFVGTWKLILVEFHKGDLVTFPYGSDPEGYIMYNQDGYMAVYITPKKRPLFTSDDLGGGSIEEKVAAAESFVGYCGTYEILDEMVVHHILVSFFPNWVGGKQERFYTFEENKLILSTAPMELHGETQSAHLTWEKITQ